MNSRGKRSVTQKHLGLTRMFREDPAIAAQLQTLSDDLLAGTRHQFDILAYTPGNDTAAAGRGPDNNLNPSTAITVDNVDNISSEDRQRRNAGLNIPIIDKYIAMICDYANANQNPPRQLRGTPPFCAHTLRSFHNHAQPNKNLLYQAASQDLTWLGYTPPVFRQIRYLFVNIVLPALQSLSHHATVMVISPEAKTVELLDSNLHRGRARAAIRANYLSFYNDYFNILNVHYGREFIPSEWKMRRGRASRQGPYPCCGFHSTANVMCLAFGYDNTKIPSRDPMLERRLLLARELWNGHFESNPASPFYYPIVQKPLDNDIRDGWTALTPAVMASLPLEARARRGKYRGPAWRTKNSVTRHCRGNLRRYRGYTTWMARPLAEYIEQVEIRDENIRTGAYRMRPP